MKASLRASGSDWRGMCAGRLAFHGSPERMQCFHQKLAKLSQGLGVEVLVLCCERATSCNIVQHGTALLYPL